MGRRLIVLLLIGVVALALGACDDGSGSDGSGGGGGGDDGPLTKSKLTGACPSLMVVGKPDTFTATIQNRGDEDWPTTFIGSVDSGSGNFAVNSITLDGKEAPTGHGPVSYGDPPSGGDTNAPTFNVYGFQGLGAGEKAKLRVRVTPEETGNTELEFTIWGESGTNAGSKVPLDAHLQGCDDIQIQP